MTVEREDMFNRATWIHRAIATVLAGAVFSGALTVYAAPDATPKQTQQVVGQLVVSGSVTVNEKRALTGASIFSNSLIKVACAKGNSALINLGKLGMVEINPGTSMVLRFSDNLVSGELIEGEIKVNTPAGVKVSITTPEGVAAADGQEPTVIPVRTNKGYRCVPMVLQTPMSTAAISAGSLAALLLGLGGAAIIGVVSSVGGGSQTSPIVP